MRVASVPAGGPAERANFKITPMTPPGGGPRRRTAGGGPGRGHCSGRGPPEQRQEGVVRTLTFMKGIFFFFFSEGSPGAAVQNPQYLHTEDQRPPWPPTVLATTDCHHGGRPVGLPDDEPGINAKSGWPISHWWGLWGPNRMDKWATHHQDQGNKVSAREWAALPRAL